MRIRRLELTAFGQHTGTTLELGAAPGAVDLVYGPNEAGKSTTLRAILGLLFGIPENTRDAYLHAPTELRIGGTLEPARGTPLDIVRRKGRKDTLLDRDGKKMDEGPLVALLGGATAELFSAMFGLDHSTLRASAKALLDGKGAVGESLFSAGMGARGIHELRERLREEADQLFTTRGRDQKLVVKSITEVREAKRTVDELSVSARGVLAQEKALEEAQRERDTWKERRATLATERARLEGTLAVLSPLARRERLAAELAALGVVVRLPPDAGSLRRKRVGALEDVRQKRRRVEGDLERVERRLAEIVVPEALIALDDAVVRELDVQRGRHASAESDLPKREGELAGHEEAIGKSLAAIDPGLSQVSTEIVRVGIVQATRIRKLAEDRRALDREGARLAREIALVAAKREHLAARLVAQVGEGSTLSAGALSAPQCLSVPGPEVSSRYAEDQVRLAAERAELGRDQARRASREREVARELMALRAAGDVPLETDLALARADRDAALAGIRETALAGTVPAADTLDAHGRGVVAADVVADRLRREADRVVKVAALAAEQAALAHDRTELESRSAKLEERARDAERAFASRWAPAGVVPLSAEEMRAWSERFGELVDAAALESGASRALAELKRDRERWDGEWSAVVSPLGLGERVTPDEAVALLEQLGDVQRRVEQRDQMRRRIEGMHRDSRVFTEAVQKVCAAHFPEGAGLGPGEAALALRRAHEKARGDEAERTRLAAEREVHKASHENVVRAEGDASRAVTALLEQGQARDLGELEAAEQKSDRAEKLEAELAELERELAKLGDGASLAALVERTRGLDADRARIRVSELEREIEEVGQEYDRAVERVATIEAGSRKFVETDAADAATELACRVATLKSRVHRYVRLRLASVLLDQEIERYRQANQGPILERAGVLFPRLTVNRYSGLRVAFGANDQPVLRAVRPEGGDVGVEALSEGTRDQLYLALRLASLERYAAHNEPMPLVLDDVLIQADDDRARAALGVLGEVARTTQVLFFTHHARLVELAREALGPSGLALHELP